MPVKPFINSTYIEMSYADSQECIDSVRALFPEFRNNDVGMSLSSKTLYGYKSSLYNLRIHNFRRKKYGSDHDLYYINQDFIKDHLDTENTFLKQLLISEAKSDEILVYLKIKGDN